MSTSPANSAEKLGQVALSYGGARDEGLRLALSSIPDFPFADAAGHLVDRKSDDQAAPATTLLPLPYPSAQDEGVSIYPPPAPERRVAARDGGAKRPQTITILPNQRENDRPNGNRLPPRDLTPDWVTQPRGYVDWGTPTRGVRRRRRYSLKKSLVTSAIAVMIGSALVVEIWILFADADFPSLPRFASGALPKPAPPSTDFTDYRAIINLNEPERMTQAVSLQPSVSLPPAAQSENQSAENGIDVTLPRPMPGPGYENAGKAAAIRQPPSIVMPEFVPPATPQPAPIARPEPSPFATAEPRWNTTSESPPIAKPERLPEPPPIARLEPIPDSPPIARLEAPATTRPEPTAEPPLVNQAPPHIGKAVAADRAGFLFGDSNVRYLTRSELQGLSADRLHIARNEIFARKGRYFKDDTLRAYFSRFSWYQPHAWDVPLGPVEQANVGLIQSIEAPAAPSRGIAGPVPAQARADDGAAFADLSHRYLTPEELQGLSADDLALVRNEIFARRGRYFKDDALRTYFSQFPWYQPHAWDIPLSPIEQANVKLVQSFEQTASTQRPAATRAGRNPPM
jgi:hypothetical protein